MLYVWQFGAGVPKPALFPTQQNAYSIQFIQPERKPDGISSITPECFYNSKRRHSYLGYLSQKEFEKMMVIKKAA
jgi:transposase InsO family protein